MGDAHGWDDMGLWPARSNWERYNESRLHENDIVGKDLCKTTMLMECAKTVTILGYPSQGWWRPLRRLFVSN